MTFLTTEQLRDLVEHRNGPCISLYMPTHRIYPGQQEDQIRFKNLVRQAEEMLRAQGLRDPEIDALLDPSRTLVNATEFWRHSDHGLAHFVAHGFTQPHRLPFTPNERVVVTDRFHLKPLMRLLSGEGHFYLLALSQNSVRFLEGTRHEVREIELESLPESLAEALRYDDPEQQLQFHTGAQGVGGSPQIGGQRAAIFHGQGGGKDDSKDRILRYFRHIDRGLHDFLRGRHEPLVLAGVEYYFPIYRQANTYSYLLDEGVPGNPEHLSNEQLHQRAWEIVEPWFWKEQEKEAERYRRWAGTGLTANQLGDIIPAAFQGRVESLIVARDRAVWGVVNSKDHTLAVHDEAQPGDEDILDCAAVQTLLHGGNVFVVDPAKVPEHSLATAVLRY